MRLRRSSRRSRNLAVIAGAFVLATVASATSSVASTTPGDARARLIRALSSVDSAVDARALRHLGGADALALLDGIARAPQLRGATRLRAAASIQLLGDAAALAVGVRLADDVRIETRIRWYASYGAIALAGRIDGPRALALGRRWLARPEPALRDAVVHALDHVDGAGATALLRQAQRDPDAEVRAAAARRLRQRSSRQHGVQR